jgi:hypothetical protein
MKTRSSLLFCFAVILFLFSAHVSNATVPGVPLAEPHPTGASERCFNVQYNYDGGPTKPGEQRDATFFITPSYRSLPTTTETVTVHYTVQPYDPGRPGTSAAIPNVDFTPVSGSFSFTFYSQTLPYPASVLITVPTPYNPNRKDVRFFEVVLDYPQDTSLCKYEPGVLSPVYTTNPTPVPSPTPTPLPTVAPIITSVTPTYRLNAGTRYLQGVPVANMITVHVDWGKETPGHVDFLLNGRTIAEPADGAGAHHTFDMGKDLQNGLNTLRITAYNAKGKASSPRSYQVYSVPQPLWMLGLLQSHLMALPLFASGNLGGQGAYTIAFHLPNKPFSIDALRYGPPDGRVSLKWGIDGEISIPLNCGSPLSAKLSGSGSVQFLYGSVGVRPFGAMQSAPVSPCGLQAPSGIAGIGFDLTGNLYRKPVLVMVSYFNAATGVTVDSIITVLHLEQFVGKLGEFYVDGKVKGTVQTGVSLNNQAPYFQFNDLVLNGSVGIQGGYRANLNVAEMDAWAGASGGLGFKRVGAVVWPPLSDWRFDTITLKGEVGVKFRALWFVQQATGSIVWTYPPTQQQLSHSLGQLQVEQWHLIPNSPALSAMLQPEPLTAQQAFTQLSTAQSVNISPLATNVYPYPEPTLAINPKNNTALLLWVQTDPSKPVGRAHELMWSMWNGSTWSAPAYVTRDTYLDGAPQVAWTKDGAAVAIWHRINAELPSTATWNTATAKQVEIATARYTPGTGKWSAVSLLTKNTALDMAPVIARSPSGDVLAVWRQNTAGALSGDAAAPDQLTFATYSQSWSAPKTALANIPGVLDVAVGYGLNKATIAFTRQLAATGTTTPTAQLFTSSWNGTDWSVPSQLTNDTRGHHEPQVLYNSANQPLLIWLAGSELRLRNMNTGTSAVLNLPSSIRGVTEFKAIQQLDGNVAVVFVSENTPSHTNLVFYDQAHTLWSNPSQVTDGPSKDKYLAPGLDSHGRLLMGYATTKTQLVNKTATLSDTGEVIRYVVPQDGPTSLMTLSRDFIRNLTLANGDLTLSPHTALGQTVVLSATIHNTGDYAVDGVTVNFYEGNPQTGGKLIAQRHLAGPLAGQFSATVTIPYTLSQSRFPVLYAVVDPEGSIAESNEHDNIAHLGATVFIPLTRK